MDSAEIEATFENVIALFNLVRHEHAMTRNAVHRAYEQLTDTINDRFDTLTLKLFPPAPAGKKHGKKEKGKRHSV